MERPDINTIKENFIDVEQMIGSKGVKVPKWAIRLIEKILHVPELNRGIYLNREYFGLDFVYKFLAIKPLDKQGSCAELASE